MAPGAGFEPARDRINSAAPFQLGYPGKNCYAGFGVAGGNRILVDGSTDRRLTTRPRPHLAPGARVERAYPAFQTGASTATAFLANLVEEEGIEPSFAGCRPAVLPLDDSPNTGCGLAS